MALPLNLRVLVADDDENDGYLLQRAFIHLGLNPPLALLYDGEQVIEYFVGQGDYSDRRTWPIPDLLLVDHWMPRVSGIDVINWLRTEPRFSKLAVLLLSGGLSPAQAEELARLHAAYCVKPTEFEAMMPILIEGFERALGLVPSALQERASGDRRPLQHPEIPW